MTAPTLTPATSPDTYIPFFHSVVQPRLVGNGTVFALVDGHARIVWLAFPKPHDTPVFMSLTSPNEGGSFALCLSEETGRTERTERTERLQPITSTQHYEQEATALRTTLVYEGGLEVAITDFMPPRRSLLIRRVRIFSQGHKTRSVRIIPDISLNRDLSISIAQQPSGAILYSNYPHAFSLMAPPDSLSVTILPGGAHSFDIVLSYEDALPSTPGLLTAEIDALYQETMAHSKNFLNSVRFPKFKYTAEMRRIALALKMLICEESGAVVAAPTTSIPSVPGGIENWDYRYCWIRDSSYTAQALLDIGLFPQVRRILEFFFKLQMPDGTWATPLYTVDGFVPPNETISSTHTTVDGKVVRFGNNAIIQKQLDSAPHIVRIAAHYLRVSRDREYILSRWPAIEAAAQSILSSLGQRDSSIWETRPAFEGEEWFHVGEKQFTYTKCLQYAGLISAAQIARSLRKTSLQSARWLDAATSLRKEILERSWSQSRQSFVQAYEAPATVDIAVLAMIHHGIISPQDKRWRSTERQIERFLVVEGGVKRHEAAIFCFYPATFWWAEHLLRTGRRAKAQTIIEQSLKASKTLLLAEHHLNSPTPLQLGNMPLAWSLAGALSALVTLSTTRRRQRVA